MPKTQIKPQQVVLDTKKFKAFVGGKEAPMLSPREWDVFMCLAKANGAVKTREDIMREWGSEEMDSRTVDQHIARLRHKLGGHTRVSNRLGCRGIINTVTARGYSVEGVKII